MSASISVGTKLGKLKQVDELISPLNRDQLKLKWKKKDIRYQGKVAERDFSLACSAHMLLYKTAHILMLEGTENTLLFINWIS